MEPVWTGNMDGEVAGGSARVLLLWEDPNRRQLVGGWGAHADSVIPIFFPVQLGFVSSLTQWFLRSESSTDPKIHAIKCPDLSQVWPNDFSAQNPRRTPKYMQSNVPMVKRMKNYWWMIIIIFIFIYKYKILIFNQTYFLEVKLY